MPRYAGLEKVDPEARKRQRILTEALWERLEDDGVPDGSSACIESILFAEHDVAAASLVAAFRDDGWRHDVASAAADSPTVIVKLISPEVELTRQAFLELVDVMMIAAHEHGCVFDGLQIDVSAIKRRPWWRFW